MDKHDEIAREMSIQSEIEGYQEIAAISRPELILISDQDLTATTFGCDQDWFADHWQRQAGCGPCTATTILYYLARSRSFLDHLYTASSHAKEDFQHFMSEIWHYVTPGHMGVNEASILADGVQTYASHHDVCLKPAVLKVPGWQQRKIPFAEFKAFIQEGLKNDCPVAFLNLSNGRLANLDSWHWVTITGLLTDGGPAVKAVIADSGLRKIIDLSQWYRTSWLGGAAVWFTIG